MIEMNETGIRVSANVVRALLAFAGDKVPAEKLYLRTVGIDLGELCATDGHAGVRFLLRSNDAVWRPSQYNGRCFRREFFDQWLAEARRKDDEVFELGWDMLSSFSFPPLGRVEPKTGVTSNSGVCLRPDLLARLEVVGKACRRPRVAGVDKANESIPLPGALITAFGHELDPVVFELDGGEAGHQARVTIMPMRWSMPSVSAAPVPKKRASRKSSAAKAVES